MKENKEEFRDSIRPFIPQLIDQLKDRDSTVRSSAALALSNLADYSEYSICIIVLYLN